MMEWKLSRSYRSGEGDVRWESFGDADAPPLVLLHGTPFSSFVWRHVVRALAGRYRVFVWDMPGYGSSEMREGQDVSLARQAEVFTELLDHWELHEPGVVAHDFGGAVALRAHLLHGARYSRMALVDVVALAPWGSPFFRLVGRHTSVFEELPPAMHEAVVHAYVGTASHRPLPADVAERLVEPWLGERGQAAFYRQIAQADQRYTDEVQDRYASVGMPVTVCWGTQDEWIPLAKGKELAALIPGASLREIPEAGHLVQEDAPAELVAALLEFLS
ncbi:alpha/beta fold hydrolase [Streptomyces sp. TR06-5]|uniref:alpha/beta fold hydrolase n=1 Tax=Streptomyces sp. TR06-5 TaxID=3385976 RepID=UPI0039A107E4